MIVFTPHEPAASPAGRRKRTIGTAASAASDAMLRALADPHRRHILKLVRNEALPAGEIATHFHMTQQAVSQHLRVLERAGLLRGHREGTRRLYAFRPESLDTVRNVLTDLCPDPLEPLMLIAVSPSATS